MLYLFIIFCVLYLVATYADVKQPLLQQQKQSPKNPIDDINDKKEDLKKEFVSFFKEIYNCFSTGELKKIESKVNEDILHSLQTSIQERDETNFTHTFRNEPSCEIHDITMKDDNVVSVKAEFKSEQVISGPHMDDITDNVVDFFIFEKELDKKNEPWKLVKMG